MKGNGRLNARNDRASERMGGGTEKTTTCHVPPFLLIGFCGYASLRHRTLTFWWLSPGSRNCKAKASGSGLRLGLTNAPLVPPQTCLQGHPQRSTPTNAYHQCSQRRVKALNAVLLKLALDTPFESKPNAPSNAPDAHSDAPLHPHIVIAPSSRCPTFLSSFQGQDKDK